MNPQDFADTSRKALIQHEDEFARRMLAAYEPLRKSLLQQIADVKERMPRVQIESHTALNWQVDRLVTLLKQVEDEEAVWRKAANITGGGQAGGAQLALDLLQEYARGLQVAWNSLPAQALAQLIGFAEDGRALREHFKSLSDEQYDTMRQTLFTGMAQGHAPNKIARKLAEDVDEFTRRRSTLIVRQETVRAFREASIQNLAENSELCDGWVWLATLSERSCPTCVALDGTVHPLTEPFGSHVSCRCVPVPHLVIDDGNGLDRPSGAEWFAKQSPATQAQILGKGKAALYQAGKIELQEVVERHPSPWGPTASIRSMKEMEETGIITAEERKAALGRADMPNPGQRSSPKPPPLNFMGTEPMPPVPPAPWTSTIQIDTSQLPDDVAADVRAMLNELQPRGVTSISFDQGHFEEQIRKGAPHTLEEFGGQLTSDGKLYINPMHYQDKDAMTARARALYEQRRQSSPDPLHALKHELGHVDQVVSTGNAVDDLTRRWPEEFDSQLWPMSKADELKFAGRTKDDLAISMSKYAMRDPAEFYAEAYAKWHAGIDLTPAEIDIVERISGNAAPNFLRGKRLAVTPPPVTPPVVPPPPPVPPAPKPPTPATAWKPMMTASEADAWAEGSAVKDAFYHGTGLTERGHITDPYEMVSRLTDIQQNGFRVTAIDPRAGVGSGHMLGPGVYMARTEQAAERYGIVLETRINVQRIWTPQEAGISWSQQYGKIQREAKKAGVFKSMTPEQRIVWWAEKNGYQAIDDGIQTVVFDPKNITVVQRQMETAAQAETKYQAALAKLKAARPGSTEHTVQQHYAAIAENRLRLIQQYEQLTTGVAPTPPPPPVAPKPKPKPAPRDFSVYDVLDEDHVARIQRELEEWDYDDRRYLAEQAMNFYGHNKRAQFLEIRDADGLAGTLAYKHETENLYVEYIGTRKGATGAGKRLMAEVAKRAAAEGKGILLTSDESVASSHGFYKHIGMVQGTGRDQNFFTFTPEKARAFAESVLGKGAVPPPAPPAAITKIGKFTYEVVREIDADRIMAELNEWENDSRRAYAINAIGDMLNNRLPAIVQRDANGNLIGAISYMTQNPFSQTEWMIQNLGTKAGAKGAGTRLMAQIAEKAAEAGKGIATYADPQARNFYFKLGMSNPDGDRFVFTAEQAKAFARQVLHGGPKVIKAIPPPPPVMTGPELRALINEMHYADYEAADARLKRLTRMQKDWMKQHGVMSRNPDIENDLTKARRDAASAFNRARAEVDRHITVESPAPVQARYLDNRLAGKYEADVQRFRSMITMRPELEEQAVLIKEETRPKKRSNYYMGAVSLTKGSRTGTTIHELGHWLEDMCPDVRRSAREFLERRTAGQATERLLDRHPGSEYLPDEICKPDNFISDYMGKIYSDGSTEIVSMALEYMHADPLKLMRDDPEMFDLIWSIMRRIN